MDEGRTLESSKRRASRRYLTILFTDLCDSTALADAMEVEDYLAVLDRLTHCYERMISKHGGLIVSTHGDGVLAMFGFPRTREDDGRRAAEAALELHASVREIASVDREGTAISLAIHSGIHSGLVLLLEDDAVFGPLELVGDVPNVAARLSELASRDEIVVSATSLGADLHFFDTDELARVSLKGKANRVAVHRILGRSTVTTREEARALRGAAPFVGREKELDVLEDALRGTLAGRPRTVACVGEAGMGKTRLVREFLRRIAAEDCQIHHAYCESYAGAEPLHPFLQIVRVLCGIRREMSPPNAAEALEIALRRLDPTLCRHRAELLRILSVEDIRRLEEGPLPRSMEGAVVALQDLIFALASQRPVVLFLDDWQDADQASRKVLSSIRRRTDRPILTILASRRRHDDDPGMRGLETMQLSQLGAEYVAETIRSLRPGLNPFTVMEIIRAAGGSPLFVEELCHSATGEGAAAGGGDSFRSAWLDTLIASRVNELPNQLQELAMAAAVIGNVIPIWLLRSVSDRSGGLRESLKALQRSDLIFPGEHEGTVRFKHGIAREVIYNSVNLHRRRSLHRAIAHLLDPRADERAACRKDENLEMLAYHYDAGNEPADAAYYAELAGDKALAVSALDRARTHYKTALEALDRLQEPEQTYERWTAIVHRLGLACVFDVKEDEIDFFWQALARASNRRNHEGLARAEYWLGYLHYGLGETDIAIRHCERACEYFRRAVSESAQAHRAPNPTGDRLANFLTQARAVLGQVRAAAGEYDGALELLSEAINVEQQRRSRLNGPASPRGKPRMPRRAQAPIGVAYSLACKGAVLGDRGMFGAAQECFQEAIELVKDSGHAVEGSILGWRSNVYMWQGRWAEGLEAATQAQAIGDRTESLYVLGMSQALGGYASLVLGRRTAVHEIAQATLLLERSHRKMHISLNYGWLADAVVTAEADGLAFDLPTLGTDRPENGYQAARLYAARAVTRARKRDRLGEAMAYRALARASAQRSDPAQAARYLDLAMESAKGRGAPHETAITRLLRASLLSHSAPRSREATTALDLARRDFEAMDMRWYLAEADRLARADISSLPPIG